MKTVVATGVFEVVHPGHILYLTEAKKLGGRLVVVVACDEVARERKRHPIVGESQRAAVVSALKPVDEVVVGGRGDFMDTVERIRPDVLALGFDQEFDEKELEEKLSAAGLATKVVRIKDHWEGPLNKTKKIIESFKRK
jgi:FAD synthetase